MFTRIARSWNFGPVSVKFCLPTWIGASIGYTECWFICKEDDKIVNVDDEYTMEEPVLLMPDTIPTFRWEEACISLALSGDGRVFAMTRDYSGKECVQYILDPSEKAES